MIMQGLLESNTSSFITDLRIKRDNLQSIMDGSQPDGDFYQTVNAQLSIVNAALDAAIEQRKEFIK